MMSDTEREGAGEGSPNPSRPLEGAAIEIHYLKETPVYYQSCYLVVTSEVRTFSFFIFYCWVVLIEKSV